MSNTFSSISFVDGFEPGVGVAGNRTFNAYSRVAGNGSLNAFRVRR